MLGGGCAAPDAAGSPRRVPLKFGKPDPGRRQQGFARRHAAQGLGSNAKAVKVNRTLRGFEGSTGVSYRVSANDQTLEPSADPTTGALPISHAGHERNPRPQL